VYRYVRRDCFCQTHLRFVPSCKPKHSDTLLAQNTFTPFIKLTFSEWPHRLVPILLLYFISTLRKTDFFKGYYTNSSRLISIILSSIIHLCFDEFIMNLLSLRYLFLMTKCASKAVPKEPSTWLVQDFRHPSCIYYVTPSRWTNDHQSSSHVAYKDAH